MTYGLDQLEEVSKYILEQSKSSVFLLFGEMGVGKTTLVKALAKTLGSDDNVSSPTYSLVNEYETINKPIYHFDFYRIKDLEEVYDIGFEDYLSQEAYILIEWPEMIEELWPNHYTKVDIALKDDGTRFLQIRVV